MSAPLAPPRTLRIKRPRDESPVNALYLDNTPQTPLTPSSKRPKITPAPPSYVFRLAHTINPVPAPPTPPKLRGATPPPTTASPPGTPEKKRKAAENVKKFTLSKKARMHPYGRVHFERIVDPSEKPDTAMAGAPTDGSAAGTKLVEAATPRKKPNTHPKEKELLRERRKEMFKKEDERLQEEMNRLVLEYLDQGDEMNNLPPTPQTRPDGRKKGGDVDAMDTDEDEEGYVYDVYFLDEAAPSGEREAGHGVIVFEDGEEQEWWYEAGREEEDDSDVYAEDDEDSNAEDYITNDYPDEEVEFSDEDEVDSDDDLGMGWKRPVWGRRTNADDEEYDLENDFSDEDMGEYVKRLERDALNTRW